MNEDKQDGFFFFPSTSSPLEVCSSQETAWFPISSSAEMSRHLTESKDTHHTCLVPEPCTMWRRKLWTQPYNRNHQHGVRGNCAYREEPGPGPTTPLSLATLLLVRVARCAGVLCVCGSKHISAWDMSFSCSHPVPVSLNEDLLWLWVFINFCAISHFYSEASYNIESKLLAQPSIHCLFFHLPCWFSTTSPPGSGLW